jgi:Lipoxygenase
VVDPAHAREDGDGRALVRRRTFVGAGLAAAGVGLTPPAGAATIRSRPAAILEDARQASGPSAGSPASGISQLPLRGRFPNLPAIPVDEAGVLDTLARLQIREQQEIQAKQGLNQKFTINGVTRSAYAFLFGGGTPAAQSDARRALAESLRDNSQGAATALYKNLGRRSGAAASAGAIREPLSLELPEQFSISWTNFPDVYGSGLRSLPDWASSLTDADSATSQFWPTIARHGFGFNLIVPERVTRARGRALRREFGAAWTRKVRASLTAGNLYVIDMSRFEALQPQTVNGAPRFTPATVTLLTRNPRTRSLAPIAILASGYQGANRRVYSRATASEGAWLYALQAAKASVTLFGVWLGHVYHWHVVTAAMQMAMFNTLSTEHPIYRLLAPQSKFLIAFDDVLFALWSQIAPPTSLASANDFFALANDYAAGRSYFDDDPKSTIKRLGLRQKHFTVNKPWDRYPVVQRLLTVWDLVATYVETFVDATYRSNATVAADQGLQRWIATAASTDASTGGNIRGLPEMNSRAALKRVLTSLLYRITIHGISRLVSTTNPAATFVSNFPHCLQRTDIPRRRARISTKALMRYLPNTDTIGQIVNFYFTFAFSTPYEPFIPLGGVGEELFFPGGRADKRNRALIDLRKGLAVFINDYQPDPPQRFQWPRNIET